MQADPVQSVSTTVSVPGLGRPDGSLDKDTSTKPDDLHLTLKIHLVEKEKIPLVRVSSDLHSHAVVTPQPHPNVGTFRPYPDLLIPPYIVRLPRCYLCV